MEKKFETLYFSQDPSLLQLKEQANKLTDAKKTSSPTQAGLGLGGVIVFFTTIFAITDSKILFNFSYNYFFIPGILFILLGWNYSKLLKNYSTLDKYRSYLQNTIEMGNKVRQAVRNHLKDLERLDLIKVKPDGSFEYTQKYLKSKKSRLPPIYYEIKLDYNPNNSDKKVI